MRTALLTVLARAGRATDLPAVMEEDPGLGIEWAETSERLLLTPEAWTNLRPQDAKALLRLPSADDAALLAAVTGGQVEPAFAVAGPQRTLSALAREKDLSIARQVARSMDWKNLTNSASDARSRVLLGAVAEGRSVPGLGEALEATRARIDETWLRSAVEHLADAPDDPGDALEVVFGPLHHAITDNRLPPDLWARLDPILPTDSDPARRLRRELLIVARNEHWSGDRLQRALRDAGPFADELLREIDEEDPLSGFVKGVVRTIGGFFDL
jgi:hypothetical protein